MRDRCLPFLTTGKPPELVIEWIIDASGGVSEVKILSPQTALDGLELCLRAVIKTWTFPATSGSRATKVSVSLSLEADGS